MKEEINIFSSSRVEVKWNGELILGLSLLDSERPKNHDELVSLLKDIVSYLEAPSDEVPASHFDKI